MRNIRKVALESVNDVWQDSRWRPHPVLVSVFNGNLSSRKGGVEFVHCQSGLCGPRSWVGRFMQGLVQIGQQRLKKQEVLTLVVWRRVGVAADLGWCYESQFTGHCHAQRLPKGCSLRLCDIKQKDGVEARLAALRRRR